MIMRSPQLSVIRWESRPAAWARNIGILFSRTPKPAAGVRTFRSMPSDRALKPVAGFLASVALHVAAFALITNLDFTSGYQPSRSVEMSDPGPIFIDLQALKDLKILRALPVVKPAGPGGQPGAAEKPVQVVLQASTAQHPKFTIVLKPLKPDNNRQAVNQKLSPPELKLQLEQKLPDIVLPDNPAIPRPRLDMALRQPIAPKNDRRQKMDAPAIASDAAPGSPFKASNPNIARPQVDMSLRQPNAPGNAQNQKSEAAPVIAGSGPAVDFQINPTVRQPQLPVSYVSGSMQAPHAGGSGTGRSGGGGGSPTGSVNGTGGNGSGDQSGGIVVVSIDPSAFSQLASLAQGNRYGQLAIAPSKEGAGSPGGSPNGTAGGGSGGPGKGGDGSIGVGPGHSGGGGGGTEGTEKATFSAVGGTGRSGGVDASKLLAPVLPATVFAVPTPASKLRRPPLVVATGPMGGGGLDAYGALSCGKVYTIFMAMPGKNWILQYCAHEGGATKAPQTNTNSGVVEVEAGLVPPTADQQFDFRRLAVPEKDGDKLIVLRGLIDKDGAISEVHVFQGVLPEMDAEAAVAFSNWKFRPATRAGVPIAVDVLVGIPARLPEKLNASSGGAPGNQN